MNKVLISIVGPTAIGKTALGIKVAQHFNTGIISADSRQFFQEMAIGTAVPSADELQAVPHHFIQHKSIEEPYSVGEFERDAINKLNELFAEQGEVVMVGGSGLYVRAVTEGLDDFPEIDPAIRLELNAMLQREGIQKLQAQLQSLDPVYFSEVDRENPHRLIRALEICLGTGRPYSTFRKKKTADRPFRNLKIGLTADRKIIYDRINRRVDLMMQQGLLEEAHKLYPQRELNALNTVGYKELFKYFDGEWELEVAISEIKKNTRRFAKRQLTWFRKDPEITWFDHATPIDEIISFIEGRIR